MDSIRVKERKASDNVDDAYGLWDWQPYRGNNEMSQEPAKRGQRRGNNHGVDMDKEPQDREEDKVCVILHSDTGKKGIV